MKYLILLFVLLISTPSFAQNKSPYDVDPAIEIPVTIGGFAAIGVSRILTNELSPAHCELDCDPQDVNTFDRTAIEFNDDNARLTSDIFFGSSLGLPIALNIIDVLTSNPEDGWLGFGKDTIVLTETLAFTMGMNNILNMSVRRPRPLVYNSETSDSVKLDSRSAFSFPSGHTSSVFAMGTAYSRLYMLRHPNSPMVVPIWIMSYAVGTTTGITRVLAGEHFWTDIMAGAGLGIASGLFIPWLHEVEGKNSLAFRISPVLGTESQGLSLTIY